MWTRESVETWWKLLLMVARDTAALTVGVWILAFKSDAQDTLLGIGYLLLVAGSAGAAKTAIRAYLPKQTPSTEEDG